MNTLIIYAHPDHESHAQFTLKSVEEKLESQNISYETLDLYKMKFNPILSKEEIYDVKTKGAPKDIAKIQQKITNSEHLILIYPVWWNGMPAIMKGFIDRAFSSGFAFRYNNSLPVGLLKGKRATIFATTGSNKIITFLFLGNRFKKNAVTDIMRFCGIKAKVYQTDGALRLSDKQREKILKNVKSALG